jgi:hypothetical protein
MKNSEVHMIVSVDQDFDAMPELKRLEPGQALTIARGAPRSTKREP